jgi:hypothetical protein
LFLDRFNQVTLAPPQVGEQVIVSFAPEDLLLLAD